MASRASWYQLAIFESDFSNPNSKCLLGCAQTPFDLHRADAGCAFVPNTSITKKQPRTLPQWKNPRLSSSIGTAFFRWCSFLLRRTVLHCAAHEEAPASRLLLCGSPGRRLSFPSAAWNILHKLNLVFRHTGSDQLFANVLIDIEVAIIFRCRKVAEQKLCQLLLLAIFPDL